MAARAILNDPPSGRSVGRSIVIYYTLYEMRFFFFLFFLYSALSCVVMFIIGPLLLFNLDSYAYNGKWTINLNESVFFLLFRRTTTTATTKSGHGVLWGNHLLFVCENIFHDYTNPIRIHSVIVIFFSLFFHSPLPPGNLVARYKNMYMCIMSIVLEKCTIRSMMGGGGGRGGRQYTPVTKPPRYYGK